MASLIPEIDAFQQARTFGSQQQAQQLQQVGALQAILAKAREQQLATQFRAELEAAPTDEAKAAVAMKYGTPQAIMGHADTQAKIASTKELAFQRLTQQAQNAARQATTAEDKALVDKWYKQGVLAIQQGRAAYELPPEFAPRVAPAPGAPAQGALPTYQDAMTTMGGGVNKPFTMQVDPASPQPVQGTQAAPVAPAPTPAPSAPPAASAPAPGPSGDATNSPAALTPPAGLKQAWAKLGPKEAAKAEAAWMAKQANSAPMDDNALKIAAWEKLLYGTDPKGLGTASAQQRAQVANERARLGKTLGLSDTEIAMMPQDNKVKMKAVDALTKWGAFVDKGAEQLIPSIDLAIDYAKKLDPTTLQTVNKGVLAGRTEFNDPVANAYAVAVNTVRREYGRLMSGPTSNAMLPVEAMKQSDHLISTALDVPAWQEVRNVIMKDAGFTKDAVKKQIDSLRSSLIPGRSTEASPAPAPAPTSIPEFATEADAIRAGVKGKVKIGGRNATIE